MFRVYHNPACVEHSISGHPEKPERVKNMLVALLKNFPADEFKMSGKCSDEQILMFHTHKHLSILKQNCDHAEQTKRVQSIDGDTAIMPATRAAIYHAAGAAVEAVDAIYRPDLKPSEKLKAAFCCTRPPGHHAERKRSMGFCFVNNAGVAARYAQECYGVHKVAVVDFDVHHGNGVEDGFKRSPTLFYGSTHERDNYPGTGKEPAGIGDMAVKPIDRRIVNRFITPGRKSKEEFRVKWRQVIDEMILFGPQLVIISAGFDAHKDDPLGGCELNEADFEWATQIVLDACVRLNEADPVPCISVLEGGYNVRAIADSAVVHCNTLRTWAQMYSREDSSVVGDIPMNTDMRGEVSEAGHAKAAVDIAVNVLPCGTGNDEGNTDLVANELANLHLNENTQGEAGGNSTDNDCGGEGLQ